MTALKLQLVLKTEFLRLMVRQFLRTTVGVDILPDGGALQPGAWQIVEHEQIPADPELAARCRKAAAPAR